MMAYGTDLPWRRRRLADEGELTLRRRAAAERPHERAVAWLGRRADANVVLAIRLEDGRLEQGEVLDGGHPLPDVVFVGCGLGFLGPPVDSQPHHVLALEIVVFDAARDRGGADRPIDPRGYVHPQFNGIRKGRRETALNGCPDLVGEPV